MTGTARTLHHRVSARPPNALAAALIVLAAVTFALSGCEGPTGPRGDGPESLTNPSIIPKVTFTYPPAGTEGPYPELYLPECDPYNCLKYPVIRIRFNKYMYFPSLEGALRLSSTSGNASIAPGGVLPLGGDIFILHMADSSGWRPGTYLDIGEEYLLTVDSTALDVNGNRLPAPYILAFTPEPFFRIVGTIPADGAWVPGPATSLVISFNAPVDSSILMHLRIEPPPVMDADWYLDYNYRQVGVYVQVRGSTTYTVTVDSGASDTLGHRLAGPFSYSFSTSPLRVIGISPFDGQTGVSPTSAIWLGFSEPIDTSTVRGALRFTPAVDYRYYSSDGLYLTLIPRQGLLPLTGYTLVIDSTLRSVAGGRLSGGFRSSFSTGSPQPLEVSYTYPADGDTGINTSTPVTVSMNQLVDTLSVPGAFRIDPQVNGSFRFSGGSSGFLFIPEPAIGAGISYTVTLDTTLRSTTGGKLGSPYRFTFATREFAIYSFTPPDGRSDVAPTYNLAAAFNGELDTATVAGALTIEPATPGTIAIDPYGFRFRPAAVWLPETEYTVRIDTTLRAEGGGGMRAPYVSRFRAAPFKIIGHAPANGFANQPVNAPVWIYCNDAVDTASLAGSFAMTDSAGNAAPGAFDFPPGFPERFAFQPASRLTPGTRYDVTVGTGFRSAHGYPITSTFQFSFRTAP